MEQLQVAEIPGDMAVRECSELQTVLPGCPVVLCVEALEDVEYLFLAGRQKVCIRKVYAGDSIEEGQEIYVTSPSWLLSMDIEPHSVELGFVNTMKTGDDYLIFLTDTVEDFYSSIPVYMLYEGSIITPVFSYEERQNTILETGNENTYVLYKEVKENEFFTTDQKGLAAWLELKNAMLNLYPRIK